MSAKHGPTLVIIVALLASAILPIPALATTVVKLSMDQLVQRADLIVQGQVQSVDTQWDENRRLIFTFVSIRVDETLKGGRPQALIIRQVGGNTGSIQMSVAGAPQFRSGEMALLFLRRQDENTFQVVGMSQGLYEIVQDFAVSNLFGADLFDSRTGEITKPLIGGRAPLEQLKTRIRELLK